MAAGPRIQRITLGDESVRLVTRGDDHARRVMVNLHENERTSVEAGLLLLAERPARLVHFDAGGTRRLTFGVDGAAFELDPNRVFSEEGLTRTVAPVGEGRHTLDRARAAARRFADGYREALRLHEADTVVALHNTGDDYSVLAYLAGGAEAGGAAAVHVEPGRHRHDFFFVTERATFEALRTRGYNVVLQADLETLTDDGSLSLYCARAGLHYVNVEARYHEVDNQVAMLRGLWEVLDRLGR